MAGFAGSHLAAACRDAGDEVTGLDAAPGSARVDLIDAEATRAAVERAAPDVVYHLAAQAHVGRSWETPATTLHDNVAMTLSLLEGVRVAAPEATVVAVGSGEAYGPPVDLPVDETALLRPQNPYAVSKASADLLAGFYADARGLRVIRARPFNHAGPGQAPSYAIATFARQVAVGLEAGQDPIPMVTGDPETRRDYTDVRDVVRAYRAMADSGETGVAYNVCSGRSASGADLLGWLAEAAGVELAHEIDPARRRPHEVREVRGSHAALTRATGWEPEIALSVTLADTVAWWRAALRAGS